MRLRGWADKNNVVVAKHAHARTVNDDAPNQSDLFHLEDYLISSVAAGTIWLVRREPFSENERLIRGHVRNACVGQTIQQLENHLIDFRGDFYEDCVNEFLMELRAEERDTHL